MFPCEDTRDAAADTHGGCFPMSEEPNARKYSRQTIKAIADAITGGSVMSNANSVPSKYRKGWELEEFFRGIDVDFEIANRSRVPAVEECLIDLIGTRPNKVEEAIIAACDPRDYFDDEERLVALVEYLNLILRFDERMLVKDGDYYRLVDIGQASDISSASVPLSGSEPSVSNMTSIDQATDPRAVFVVHGRNGKARDALIQFLRSIDLRPIEWNQAVHATGKPTPYIDEILKAGFREAQAAVVLVHTGRRSNFERTLLER